MVNKVTFVGFRGAIAPQWIRLWFDLDCNEVLRVYTSHRRYCSMRELRVVDLKPVFFKAL